MVQAYLVYFGLLTSLILLARRGRFYFQSVQLNKNYLIVSFFSIVLFSLTTGLRYVDGGDFMGYLIDYNNLNLEQDILSDSRYNFGYFGLMYVLKTLGLPPQFLFVTIAFLQISLIYKWCSTKKFLLPWVIFFYFTTLLLFESMNIIRQAIALSMILYSTRYIHNSERIKFILIIILAYGFHSSAIFFLPFYFLIQKDFIKNKIIKITLLIFSFILSEIIFSEFFRQFTNYSILIGAEGYARLDDDLFTENRESSLNIGIYSILIIDIIILYYSDKLKKIFREYNFTSYLNFFYLGALISPVISSTNSVLLYRVFFYFTSFRFIVLSFLCFYLFSIKKNFVNKLIGYLIVLFFLLWFINAINNGSAMCSPFQFFFHNSPT